MSLLTFVWCVHGCVRRAVSGVRDSGSQTETPKVRELGRARTGRSSLARSDTLSETPIARVRYIFVNANGTRHVMLKFQLRALEVSSRITLQQAILIKNLRSKWDLRSKLELGHRTRWTLSPHC